MENGTSILPMNYAREKQCNQSISGMKYFVWKNDDENFSNGLFGIEVNTDENKVNYGINFIQLD